MKICRSILTMARCGSHDTLEEQRVGKDYA